jgi:HemY protein
VKNIFYFLLALAFAVAVAFGLRYWLAQFDNPGYVLMGIGNWSIETSLLVFVTALVIFFTLLYFLFRLIGWLIRLPGMLNTKRKDAKSTRSQEALISGLVDSAEGNWVKAEKTLIKHASNSSTPLIHYLTAARAAQSRGAYKKRDKYLEEAGKQGPDAEIAVGLTQAELHFSGNQFDEALETLSRLHSIDPSHASVMKLLHQTYQKVGDWEGIKNLLPSLNKNKVLMEAEVKLLEAETFSSLLKEEAGKGDANAIQALWQSVPDHVKAMQGISAIYFAAMIEAQAGNQVETEITAALDKNWDRTLLSIFGSIESDNVTSQLGKSERWLKKHPNDAILLRILGKLSIKVGDAYKSEQYLSKSISTDPTVEAYRLLGNFFSEKGDKDRANDCFRKGLELASSEVVHNVEEASLS